VSPGAAERYRAAAGSATIAGARSSKYRVYDSQILNHVVVANAQATMIANPYVERRRRQRLVGRRRPAGSGDVAMEEHDPPGLRSLPARHRQRRAQPSADARLGPGGRPAAGSPAIDAGLDTPRAGPLDLYGAPRRQGRAIDIGAVEHSAWR
jgi:hypothetical protein